MTENQVGMAGMTEDASTQAKEELAPFHEVRIGRDDTADIRRSFDENGYLLFKSVLKRDLVLKAKADMTDVLRDQGFVEGDSTDPVVKPGTTAIEVDSDPLHSLQSTKEVMASPELQEALDIAYGEEAYIARSLGIRYSMPTDGAYLTPSHQDYFYIRETDEFRMIWIPLMDMKIVHGGLAIAAGSHKHGLRDHVEFEGIYSYSLKGRTQKGVVSEDVRGVWTSSPFEVGDLLMFHSCAVHRSLPNTSGLIRLALNAITYPARRPKIWQAERTEPELQIFREQLQELCEAEGIGGDLFEKIAIEAMKQGEDPSRELVLKLAEQLK